MSSSYALSGIDYACMIIYLLFTILFGLYLGRNIKSDKDYFLAGRSLPWWAIGMSLVVSDIGAIDIVGIAGAAYLSGIVLGNFDWIGCIPVMIIGGMLFIPYIWRSGSYTVPEFLGKRYNQHVRTIMSLIWGIFLACNLGIMLFATAKMLGVMLGWNTALSIIVSAVAIGLYTLVGGLAAVVYTDVIQCIVMFIGCTITLFLGLNAVGGFGELITSVQAMGEQYQHHFDLVLPADAETDFPWSGVFFGLGLVLAPAYWFTNQSIVQRCFGARSEFEAKASLLFGAILKTFIPFVMVVPGIIALQVIAPVEDGDEALPTLIREMLPSGLLGIFFAAFLAAFMSSVDSSLNSASTLWTQDIYRSFLAPNRDDKHYLIIGRLITVFFIIFGTAFAFFVEFVGQGIYSMIQTLLSLFQGPSLMLIILGILWWRTTGIGALVGLVLGLFTSSLLLLIVNFSSVQLFQINDPFLYIAWWSFVVSMISAVVVSLMTKPEPEEKLVGMVFNYKGAKHG